MCVLAFTTGRSLANGAAYDQCCDFVTSDETHDYVDGNLVTPFRGHAQIEEQNAYFHDTIGNQSMSN